MKNEDNTNWALTLLAAPALVVVLFLATLPFVLFNAWVILTLYNWFVLPLGAPSLNIWHVWGILLLIGRAIPMPTPEVKDSKMADAIGKLIGFVLAGLFALLIGYVLKGMI